MANNEAPVVLDDEVKLIMKHYTLGEFIQFFNALKKDLTQFNTNNVTKLVDSRKFTFQTRFGVHFKRIDNSYQIIIMLVALSDPDSIGGSENSIRSKLRRCITEVYYFDLLIRYCISMMEDNTVIRDILQTNLRDATGSVIDQNTLHANIMHIIQQNKDQFIDNVNQLIEHMKEVISSGYLDSAMLHANTIQKLKTPQGKLTYRKLTRNLFDKTKGSHRPTRLISNYIGPMSNHIQSYADNNFLLRSSRNIRNKAIDGKSFIHKSVSERYLELIQLLSFKTNQVTSHYYIPFRDTSRMANADNIHRTRLNNTRIPLLEVNLHLRQKFNVFKKGETPNSVIEEFTGKPVICLTTNNHTTYIFPVFTGIQIIQNHDGKQGVRVNYRNTFGERTLDIFHNCVMALLQPTSFMNALSRSMGIPETSTPPTQRYKPTSNNGKRRRLDGGNKHKKVHSKQKQTKRKKNNSKKGKRKTMNKHKNKH